jgi:hypothetical protein
MAIHFIKALMADVIILTATAIKPMLIDPNAIVSA